MSIFEVMFAIAVTPDRFFSPDSDLIHGTSWNFAFMCREFFDILCVECIPICSSQDRSPARVVHPDGKMLLSTEQAARWANAC